MQAGVAQSEIFSAVLLCLYVNDVLSSYPYIGLALYADNTAVITTYRQPALFVRYLETYLCDRPVIYYTPSGGMPLAPNCRCFGPSVYALLPVHLGTLATSKFTMIRKPLSIPTISDLSLHVRFKDMRAMFIR
jgi:hypothetical protein